MSRYQLIQGREGCVRPGVRERDSSFELMRIVLMLLIIAHHSVVNSGVMDLWSLESLNANAAFLTVWGMWGKICINSYVMVTGYFMCSSRLTWRKYFRLLSTVVFWIVSLDALLLIAGKMSVGEALEVAVSLLRLVDNSFISSILALYLMIPALNCLVSHLAPPALLRLILVGLLTSCVSPTFLKSASAFSEVFWYCTLYLMAAQIRLRPPAWVDNPKIVRLSFLGASLASIASVIGIMAVGKALGMGGPWTPYYLVNDSGKILAALNGILCFLFFRSLKIKRSRIINEIASTVFGILLIHAHSWPMRKLLWGGGSSM